MLISQEDCRGRKNMFKTPSRRRLMNRARDPAGFGPSLRAAARASRRDRADSASDHNRTQAFYGIDRLAGRRCRLQDPWANRGALAYAADVRGSCAAAPRDIVAFVTSTYRGIR